MTKQLKHSVYLSLVLANILACNFLFAQANHNYYLKNYSEKEYDAAPQNWCITQDKDGAIYVGNKSVLRYDGVDWSSYEIDGSQYIRSMDVDNKGRVFVGTNSDFGYLAPTSKGYLVFHSLTNLLDSSSLENFTDIWKTHCVNDKVYFQSFTTVYIYANGKIETLKSDEGFFLSNKVNNKVFIQHRTKGLMLIEGNKLKPIIGGTQFVNTKIASILPIANDNILIATKEDGIYISNGKLIVDNKDTLFAKRLITEVEEDITKSGIYNGSRFNEKTYLFGTLSGGAFVIDINGKLIKHFDNESGLQNDQVLSSFVDSQGDFWLGLDKGISHIEYSSPITFLHNEKNTIGSIQDITNFKNVLLVATTKGLFSSINNNSFTAFDDVSRQCWKLFSGKNKEGKAICLVATASDILELKIDNGLAKVNSILDVGAYAICQSRTNKNLFHIGTKTGLIELEQIGNSWKSYPLHVKIQKEIKVIEEDNRGNIWLGCPNVGIIKLTKQGLSYTKQVYEMNAGLPETTWNFPLLMNDSLAFATETGLYFYKESTRGQGHFFNNKTFNAKIYNGPFQIWRALLIDNKLWMHINKNSETNELGYFDFTLDEWIVTPLKRIPTTVFNAFLKIENQILLGSQDGIFSFNASIKKNYSQTYKAIITGVIAGSSDSLFFGNYLDAEGYSSINQPTESISKISYDKHKMLFHYSALFFENEENNLYSCILDGDEKEWGAWTKKAEKEYTNLAPGKYTFRVKAKNIYGIESKEATYEFTILPPWYLTAWAYLLYIIAAIAAVYGIVQLSVRRLKLAQIKLESIVKERTAEVVKQKEEIESQKHLVEEKNKEIIDSINYAKRLQQAILPPLKMVHELLPNSFVLYKPKDIVAGDFYWMETVDNGNTILIAAADCTGHGVPGALVSVVCSNALNRSVNEMKITEPGLILDKTTELVLETFAKSGEDVKDGMDVSLLSVKRLNEGNTVEIKWSGANNPLWYTNNGVMEEIKATKQPVGKHDNHAPFKTHTVVLNKGESVYLFTDGYADQFGGPKGKKFMYRQLEDVLLKNQINTAQEQHDKLTNAFDSWVTGFEQIDDVCIIGIKL